jgi:ribonucleoside-diphosphate reductase alpha chain
MNEELLKYFNGDDLAAKVWLEKYALESEITPDDMHKRLAKQFARIEIKNKKDEKVDNLQFLSFYGKERLTKNKNVESYIYNLFKEFKYVVPQGSIMSQLGSPAIGSLSNCFVVGQPADSYGGIFQKDQEIAQLEKRRGGVGIDISTLRPESTPTSNAAKTSTGAVSFMHRFSNTTREVAQNGRRGALMISMDINHPDIMHFIVMKRDLSQVTGANISIKLNDDFMLAKNANKDYLLRFPCDMTLETIEKEQKAIGLKEFPYNELYVLPSGYVKRIKAREYWNETITSAHKVAEPGLMYWNAMINYSPDGVYPQFKQITTNPCSEIGMQEYDACRLIAVNLFSFVTNPFTDIAFFDFDKFYEVNYESLRIGDNLIDLEVEHIDRILSKIENDPEPMLLKLTEITLWKKIKSTALASRRIGLGFTALGDVLAALNINYGSIQGDTIIEAIMSVKMKSELDCSTDLSILRGPFEGWDKNLEFHVDKKGNLIGNNDFYKFIVTNYPDQANAMFTFGRRNVSWSTVAPTGTVSLMTQTTSGIEPLFQPFYTRRKKINSSNKNVKIDFTDQNGDTWQEFAVLHPKFQDWLFIQYKNENLKESFKTWYSKIDLNEFFKISPWYGCTANDIPWEERVNLQATIQKYISHSISSTINLPEDISEETVSKIYTTAWEKNIKGITVYRDGSRSGVLVTDTTAKSTFSYNNAIKRPQQISAEAFTTTAEGEKYSVFVGLMDNIPYEVFAYLGGTKIGKGTIIKEGSGNYSFIGNDDNSKSRIITGKMNEEQEIVTRLISGSLRHGRGINFIVDDLNKSSGSLFSFNFAIAKVLKQFIPDGAKSSAKCNACNSTNVIFEEGCSKCLDCGSSAC